MYIVRKILLSSEKQYFMILEIEICLRGFLCSQVFYFIQYNQISLGCIFMCYRYNRKISLLWKRSQY